MQFVLASHNLKKLREMRDILGGLGVDIVPLPEGAPTPEETGGTFEENARIKALSAAQYTGLPALADDSGLCVDALGGAPGVYSARFCEGTDADRNALLLQKMAHETNRACRFVCAVACVQPDGQGFTVRGECEGELLHQAQGQGGFGYDPLFYVPAYGCTFAELPAGQKNEISHRGRALRRLAQALAQERQEKPC